jgi:uncharacterized membrane protein YeaQ/YmgE (transglycosylase-associated protein family)/uncharacterized protein YjbJ (UPF0337 family)
MNFIIWLFAGAVVGGLATVIIRNRRTDLLFNIGVGTVGAFLASFLLAPMFHINTINQGIFNLPALGVSLIGAVILLAVINFLRRENNVKNRVIESKWEQVRGKIHARWGKLTEQDIAKINGNHAQFIVTLQERYGYAKNEAENQIQSYLKAVLYM